MKRLALFVALALFALPSFAASTTFTFSDKETARIVALYRAQHCQLVNDRAVRCPTTMRLDTQSALDWYAKSKLSPVSVLSMVATDWNFEFGNNTPANPDALAWSFTFPQWPGAEVDYLVTPVNLNLTGYNEIVAVTRTDILSGAPVFTDHDTGGCESETMATIILQVTGDNMVQEDGRWWAEGARIHLNNWGLFVATHADLTDLHVWRNVQGHYASDRPSQFASALTHIGNIGFTFGGCAFGHGAGTLNGTARFWGNRMTAQ